MLTTAIAIELGVGLLVLLLVLRSQRRRRNEGKDGIYTYHHMKRRTPPTKDTDR